MDELDIPAPLESAKGHSLIAGSSAGGGSSVGGLPGVSSRIASIGEPRRRENRELGANDIACPSEICLDRDARRDPCPGGAYVGHADDIDDAPLIGHLPRWMSNKTGFRRGFYADRSPYRGNFIADTSMISKRTSELQVSVDQGGHSSEYCDQVIRGAVRMSGALRSTLSAPAITRHTLERWMQGPF